MTTSPKASQNNKFHNAFGNFGVVYAPTFTLSDRETC